MARQTNAERIVVLLRRHPGLNDDEISDWTEIRPRQQVNQICRRLESRNLLNRSVGAQGKIVNVLVGTPSPKAPQADPSPSGRNRTGRRRSPPKATNTWYPLRSDKLSETLLIIPCSKAKAEFPGRHVAGPRIGNRVSASLRERLDLARAANRKRVEIDERTLAPAWQRYAGRLYQAAGGALDEAVSQRLHLLILSGGYGALLAREPIGRYDAVLKTSWWPGRVLEDVLAGYARRHKLKRMRAFVSETTAYRKVVERVDWKNAGVDDAVLLIPERGSQDSVTRTQGEAFAALLGGTLEREWRSAVGLRLICRKLD